MRNNLNEVTGLDETENELDDEEEEKKRRIFIHRNNSKRRRGRKLLKRRMIMNEDSIKYLIICGCLLLICFLIIPIIFFYDGGTADQDSSVITDNDQSTNDVEINKDSSFSDENSKETLSMITTPRSSDTGSKRKTSCRDYYFPCDRSLDKNNDTICINRLLHCNQKIDCPNGEDELECNYIPIDIKNNFNITSLNSTILQKYESNYHGNCSLFDLIQGKCVCHMDHKEKADCKNQGLTSIPNQFRRSITSINLEGNQITVIDTSAINSYVNLTIISLRYNQIQSIPPFAFYQLSKLTRLYLRGNRISFIDSNAFVGLTALSKLYINENQLKNLDLSMFSHIPNLKLLDLAQNLITFDSNQSFPHLDRLDWLDLSENKLNSLSVNLLPHLNNLTKIHLNHNKIANLEGESFAKNTRLIEINLSNNLINNFPKRLFKHNTLVRTLNLENNYKVNWIPKKLFLPLKNLQSLNLTGITIDNVVKAHFESNSNLTHLYFSKFKYCLYAPHVRVCVPSSDGVSSLQHLLIHSLLRVSVWFVAAITCFGNLIVIIWRSFSTKEDEVLSLFVKNLSVADFLMGAYLVAIGINDVKFADKYLESALGWMYSWKCTAIGVLAMISSELSVLILTIVAIERYRSITFNSRLVTVSSARILMAVAWSVAIFISIYPLIHGYTSRENDDEDNDDGGHTTFDDDSNQVTGYYGSNGLCFPLHIDDPFAPGWKYSAFVLLGINFMAVISMLILYMRMFMVLSRDRSLSRPGCIDVNREDMILAVRFFFIVLTDCLCWLPIVAIKFIAFTSISIHPTIYAWVVVFILPINSALNPIIYTIAAPTSIRRIIHSKLRSTFARMKCVNSRFCPCCPTGFDETRSMADSTTTYMSDMLSSNNNKKRTSSDGSVISMALLTTPFLSINGSRRTSYEFRRHSSRSDYFRPENGRFEFGRPEFTRSELEKSELIRLDSGRSGSGRRSSGTSIGSRIIFKFPDQLRNGNGNGTSGRNGSLATCGNLEVSRKGVERQRSFDLQSLVGMSAGHQDSLDQETTEEDLNTTKSATTQLNPIINVTSV